MLQIQNEENLLPESMKEPKLTENYLIIERILQGFPQMEDEMIQNFIQEGLQMSSNVSEQCESRDSLEQQNLYMTDDLIRFSGILMLNLYLEEEKLKKEIQEMKHVVSSEFPMRSMIWKVFKYIKRKMQFK